MKGNNSNRIYNEELVEKLVGERSEIGLRDRIREMKAENGNLSENELSMEYMILSSMMQDSEYYTECIKIGMLPQEAEARFLRGRTPEEQRDEMQARFDLFKPNWVTRDKIDDISQRMIDARYGSPEMSEFLKGIQNGMIQDEVRLSFDLDKHQHHIRVELALDEAAAKDLYRRSGLEKKLDIKYLQLPSSHCQKLKAHLNAYFENDSAELSVAYFNGECWEPQDVAISREEQTVLTGRLESEVLHTSVENHIARKLSYEDVETVGAKNPVISKNIDAVYAVIEVSPTSISGLLKAAGLDKKGNGQETYEVIAKFPADCTDKNTDGIQVALRGGSIDGELRVPCRIADKQGMLKAFEHSFGTVEEYLKKNGSSEQAFNRTKDIFKDGKNDKSKRSKGPQIGK